MYLRDIGCENINWVELRKEESESKGFVKMTHIEFHKNRDFSDQINVFSLRQICTLEVRVETFISYRNAETNMWLIHEKALGYFPVTA